MYIKNGEVFTEDGRFEKLGVLTENGIIKSLLPDGSACADSEVIDAEGCYVVPGLADIHLHGCMGHDPCDGTAETFETIAKYQLAQGVTTICPATMTLPDAETERILSAYAEYAEKQYKDLADIAGLHLEGPFINAEKCGAQKSDHIQKPSSEKLRKWQQAAKGMIKLVTIAPETEGAVGLIKEFSGEIHFSLGHTACNYDTAAEAFKAGADHVTHLYNAMPPFSHRAPSLIGAAFDTDGVFAELICDGIHVSPVAVRAAFKLFGEDRVILISDSMEATGLPDGEYSLGGQRVYVNGSRATLSDGTLAGSVSSLYVCFKKAVEFGIPLISAIKAAAVNPCRAIGLTDRGSISQGKKAHMLILEKDSLKIRRVIK